MKLVRTNRFKREFRKLPQHFKEQAKSPVTKEEFMDYHQHIVRDPQICGGESAIRGTRVTIRTILASLVEGTRVGEILEDFPSLTEEDVHAVIAFAAVSAAEDLPIPSVPSIR